MCAVDQQAARLNQSSIRTFSKAWIYFKTSIFMLCSVLRYILEITKDISLSQMTWMGESSGREAISLDIDTDGENTKILQI